MNSKTNQDSLTAAYAGIVDAMILAARGCSHRRWLITAARTGDGTTTTAIGIARALAARQYRALLVDANLRSPRISQQLDVPESPGLVQLILNGHRAEEVCCRRDELGDFAVVPAGQQDVEPVELLSKSRAAEVLEELSKTYDFVVIDTPALNEGLDAVALAPHVDGCVLVVRAGKTGRQDLVRAREQIQEAGGKIVGLVFNQHRLWVPRLLGGRR